MTATVIDVTPVLREGMPTYPGNPPFALRVVRSLAEGARSTLSEVTMGTHSGLHVDAPSHFIEGAAPLEATALDALVGPARVLGIKTERVVEVEHLLPHDISEGERILLKTSNSALWEREGFVADYVYLSTAAAHYLAERRIACLGVDYLSVGGKENGVEVHQTLLRAGILLIEGLDLSSADPGEYDLACLPLRLAHAEAAPARAVLRKR